MPDQGVASTRIVGMRFQFAAPVSDGLLLSLRTCHLCQVADDNFDCHGLGLSIRRGRAILRKLRPVPVQVHLFEPCSDCSQIPHMYRSGSRDDDQMSAIACEALPGRPVTVGVLQFGYSSAGADLLEVNDT